MPGNRTPSTYQADIEGALDRAISPDAWEMAQPRNKLGRTAQRFALIRYTYNKATKLYDSARAEIVKSGIVPLEVGKHVLCDTPQVFLAASVLEPARRLNEQAVVDLLMERMDIDEAEAQAMVDSCKLPGDPVIKLEVTLK